ncbi:ATP-binding protein, partial [Streptococcus pyogenes]
GYYVLIETFSYIEFEQQVDTLDYRKLLVIIYLILFMGVLNRLDKHLRERIQEKLDFQQELQLRDMEDYSRHIEELYKEVRGFRHDYSNLL